MAVRVAYPEWWNDQEFYPLHEEDDVPENPPHEATTRYLRDAIAAHFPAWFVTGDVCVYWEPGNTRAYRAPDVLVVKEPLAEQVYRVYLTWRQPPIAFVAEIGSRSTFRVDEGPKVEIYQDWARAAEYFYADPPNGNQRLWRLGPDGYQLVAPEANGRLRSAELGLELGLDEAEMLWLYTPDGVRLLTHAESEAQRGEEARRRREAEAQREEAARRRREAEAQRKEEMRRRQEAEAHREEEARRRQEVEARLAQMERELAELRARQKE